MEVSCDQGVASQVGPESCGGVREGALEALTGEGAGRVLSLENLIFSGVPTPSCQAEGHSGPIRHRKDGPHPAWSETPCTHRSTSRGSREIPVLALPTGASPRREPARGTPAMYRTGKSDRPVVPAKFPNKAGGALPAAEGMEGRGLAKEKHRQRTRFMGHSAHCRKADLPHELARLRPATCRRCV